MNAFEQRLKALAECPEASPLARRLRAFRRLEQDLEVARWQVAAGTMSRAHYNAYCRELDYRLERLSRFCERFRENRKRAQRAARRIREELGIRAGAEVRSLLAAIDGWIAAFDRGASLAFERCFHRRLELLLGAAEDLVASELGEDALALPLPARRVTAPAAKAGQLAEAARAAVARRLAAVDAAAAQEGAPASLWKELREYRPRLLELLEAGRAHEANWLSLEMAARLREAARPSVVFGLPEAPMPERRFRRHAHKLAELLKEAAAAE